MKPEKPDIELVIILVSLALTGTAAVFVFTHLPR